MNNLNSGSRDNVSNKTKILVKMGLLVIIAVILQALEFPIPFFPPFLKIDFSDLPAVIGAFALGPVAGVTIELVKNLMHFVLGLSSTAGVGEIANFLVGCAWILPASLIYKHHKSKSSALIGLLVGVLVMTAFASAMNYFVMFPFYGKIFGIKMEDIVQMFAAVNSLVVDMKTLIIFGVVPFNLIKGILISIVTLLIYKRISPILHR